MKKALIGLGLCSLLLLVIGITVLSVSARNAASCDKLATLSAIDKPSEVNTQKSYAIRFPLL